MHAMANAGEVMACDGQHIQPKHARFMLMLMQLQLVLMQSKSTCSHLEQVDDLEGEHILPYIISNLHNDDKTNSTGRLSSTGSATANSKN
jgi:hypothetical protein